MFFVYVAHAYGDRNEEAWLIIKIAQMQKFIFLFIFVIRALFSFNLKLADYVFAGSVESGSDWNFALFKDV